MWIVAETDRRPALPEYRMGELARISGVSTRNIRAYRERGLLDPPRRLGRAAIYDDHHVTQLQAINQLLRRGFTSAHIAEFFGAVRSGTDLTGFLGLGQRTFVAVADGHEADALLRAGLVRHSGTGLTWVNPAIGAIVAKSEDQRGDVRFILELVDAVDPDVRRLADGVAATVGRPDAVHRELARLLTADRLDQLLDERL